MFQKATSRFVLLIFLAGLFLLIGVVIPFDRGDVEGFLSRMPVVWSGAVFIVLYVILSFFIWIGPKDIFKIVGAVLYGPYLSSGLVYIAEMLNAIALFSLSRRLGRPFVESRLRGRMRQVDQAIADTGFLSIFFLRFFPVVPFRFLDLGFGLTKISLKKYLMIAMLGSLLRIFIVQLFLSLGWDMIVHPQRFAEYLLQHPHILRASMAYMVGSIVAAFWIGKKMRRPACPPDKSLS